MLKPLAAVITPLLVLALAGRLPAEPPGSTPEQIRAAVARSISLLQKGAAGYVEHRECFSCHHQALPVLALSTARSRGFEVSDDGLRRQLRFTADSLARGQDGYLKGKGQGGQADTAGYALLALDVGGWGPDATTAAVVEYLLQRDASRGHWRVTSRRPPSEASSFTTTYLALRGLRKFSTAGQRERSESRIEQALRWLLTTPPADTEDRVFRLGALRLAGATEEDVQAAARDLIKGQRPDGGWSQAKGLDSDAYATGSALVMLHQAGGLAATDPVYRHGLKFLAGTQEPDGSWRVHSRSRPFQTYFESGFPHGKDQFISIAASSWATTALILACPAGP